LRNKHLPSADSAASSSSARTKGGGLSRCVEVWLADGQAQGWSPRTLAARRDMLGKFVWWLRQEERSDQLAELSADAIRFFLTYLRTETVGARWDSAMSNASRPARPSTVDTYYRALRAFFNFAVREGLLDVSPCQRLKPPRVPKDQVQPFTLEQAQALLDAAKRSAQPARDTAIVLVLLDTGLRVSELCSLRVGDVDPETKEITVRGKGGKRRTIFVGPNVRRVVWRYIERERRLDGEDESLFIAHRGRRTDAGLTPNGICQLFHRLGRAAGIRGVRCSPHTARHYFAVTMLRNGANLFELQQLMGHEDLTVLRRYVALAEADLARVHRTASPAARLKA
jgi:site-specific recombinase XerD